MNLLKIQSIKWKLTALVSTCCFIALLIACVSLIWDHIGMSRDQKVKQLTSAAELLASNSTAAMSFQQAEAAEELLQSLSTIETICYARLIDNDGEALASYSRHPEENRDGDSINMELGSCYSPAGSLEILVPVKDSDEELGSLYLEASLEDLNRQVRRYAWSATLIMALSLLVAIAITIKYQRIVSGPILKLATAAREISIDGNYSVRVSSQTSGELDTLYTCFNGMLEEIERAKNSLVDAKDQLEIRVAERTADLHEANQKIRAEFEEKEKLNAHMVKLSHQAGKAEIATGVLHNVGNVLNSINVSAGLVAETLQLSRLPSLRNISDLLNSQNDVAEFMASSERGKALPTYLDKLVGILQKEQETAGQELESLGKHLEHVKTIVSMQQSYAGVSAVKESVSVNELFDDAETLIDSSLKKHNVEVDRQFPDLPRIKVEKQKLLQVIVNLMKNAKDAMRESHTNERLLTINTRVMNGDRLHISFTDQGSGIEPENLTKIFSHGFTTKSDGHGFGLHSCANAINEMKGKLSAHSDGADCGATFLIDIPFEPVKQEATCLN